MTTNGSGDPRDKTTIIAEANEAIERLFELDKAVANARAFRALLENLHARNLTQIGEPHVSAIYIVRAAILRAAIGTIMSCLDPADRRGNRASVGEIVARLEDPTVAGVMEEPRSQAEQRTARAKADMEYKALLTGVPFAHGRRLRTDMIAHILLPDTPTPEVPYATLYALHDLAEQLTRDLYLACGRGTPEFDGHRGGLEDRARVFWDTYFAGILAG